MSLVIIHGMQNNIAKLFSDNEPDQLYNKTDVDELISRIVSVVDQYIKDGDRVVVVQEKIDEDFLNWYNDHLTSDKYNVNTLSDNNIIEELKPYMNDIEIVNDTKDIINIENEDSILVIGLFLDIEVLKTAIYLSKLYDDRMIKVNSTLSLASEKDMEDSALIILDRNCVFDIGK